jgi:hypothetical protein
MTRLIAALSALALLIVACAEPDPTPGPGDQPTPGVPTPTEDETPTPEPTEEVTPEPTPDPTPTPAPEARFDTLEEGDVMVVVTDDLVVRSAPEISDASEIHERVLQPGDVVWYRDGPAEGSGHEWIEGDVIDPSEPDNRLTGWIAVADDETGEAWLMRLRPEGEGWRLLGEGAEGMAYTIGVALDQADYEAEWSTAEAGGEPPQVDFESELVVRFTHVVSSTCTYTELYGVAVDLDEGMVFSAASGPRPSEEVSEFDEFVCTLDARPYAFLVAIEREVVPSGEVRFQLDRRMADAQVTIELP